MGAFDMELQFGRPNVPSGHLFHTKTRARRRPNPSMTDEEVARLGRGGKASSMMPRENLIRRLDLQSR